MEYLKNIDSPKDLKNLELKDLEALAAEIREGILYRNSKLGGHVGPNLGFVEPTIALHYVFDSPNDKIVFDVSHQSYAHKMLTGRRHGFFEGSDITKISGYTNPRESEHDFFATGHTSTSISLACGLVKARDIKGEKTNIVAIIGDGSLSGGEALEGLNNAAIANSNMIIIVNDNEMSIAENHGGLYTNLRLLRETHGTSERNMFKALGFDYHYLEEANSISHLIELFSKVKDVQKPTILHLHTLKGKGYKFAEERKEEWHFSAPFNIQTGEKDFDLMSVESPMGVVTFHHLSEKIKQDQSIVVINAATPINFGLTEKNRNSLGRNYVDVGIAEEHAVAMSSALAKGGCKPVFCVRSTFIQRTYDQLSQDLALNQNPAVILLFGGAITKADMTHLGIFDIPLVSNIPNIVFLSPTTKQEYLAMLDWGLDQRSHPVVIRVPKAIIETTEPVDKDYSKINTYKVSEKGKDVAILGLGNFFHLGQQVWEKLKEQNIHATLINPRFTSGVDIELMNSLKKDHKIVVTLEDGQLEGGFGPKIASFYGNSDMKVLGFGAQKMFTDRVPLQELHERFHLTPELIVADILREK